MRQVDYDKQTLKEAETEMRRLIVVDIYGFKDYIRKDLTEQEKLELKEYRQTMLKATFKQFGNFKKLYKKEIESKAEKTQ